MSLPVQELPPLPTLEIVGDDLKGLDGLLNFRFENLKLENWSLMGQDRCSGCGLINFQTEYSILRLRILPSVSLVVVTVEP